MSCCISSLYSLSSLLLLTALGRTCCNYPHFTDKATELRKGQVIRQKSHSELVAEKGFESLGRLTLESVSLAAKPSAQLLKLEPWKHSRIYASIEGMWPRAAWGGIIPSWLWLCSETRGGLETAPTRSSSYYTPWGPEAPGAVLPAKKPWIITEVSEAISCTRSTPLGTEVSKIQILSSIRITEAEAINFKHK